MSARQHIILDDLPAPYPGGERCAGCALCGLNAELCAKYTTCRGEPISVCKPADARAMQRKRKRERGSRV